MKSPDISDEELKLRIHQMFRVYFLLLQVVNIVWYVFEVSEMVAEVLFWCSMTN